MVLGRGSEVQKQSNELAFFIAQCRETYQCCPEFMSGLEVPPGSSCCCEALEVLRRAVLEEHCVAMLLSTNNHSTMRGPTWLYQPQRAPLVFSDLFLVVRVSYQPRVFTFDYKEREELLYGGCGESSW